MSGTPPAPDTVLGKIVHTDPGDFAEALEGLDDEDLVGTYVVTSTMAMTVEAALMTRGIEMVEDYQGQMTPENVPSELADPSSTYNITGEVNEILGAIPMLRTDYIVDAAKAFEVLNDAMQAELAKRQSAELN
jgi:hypothetical protein